jgi:hypothetical protein
MAKFNAGTAAAESNLTHYARQFLVGQRDYFQSELDRLDNETSTDGRRRGTQTQRTAPRRGRRKMSAEGRKRISEMMKKRWADRKAAQESKSRKGGRKTATKRKGARKAQTADQTATS